MIGIAVAAIVLFVNFALPHRMRLIGVALLLVPQIYVPELPVTVAFLWTLLTCLAGWMAKSRPPASSSLIAIAALFVAAIAVSLLWALPGGYDEGIVAVFRGLLFTLWLREVIVLARAEPGLIDTIVMWTTPGIALQSLATILFRIDPAIEERFHRSALGALTMGPGVQRLYSDLRNNVLDPNKAGGFFTNGNHAAFFGGAAALLLIVAARRTGHRWLYGISALSFAGSALSGSKGGLAIGVGCAVAVLFLPHMLRGRAAMAGLVAVPLVPFLVGLVGSGLERLAPALFSASEVSIGGRGQVWTRAWLKFQESPVFGVGYGGWNERISGAARGTSVPPHNMIISSWAYSGVVAAALLIVFLVATIGLGLRVAAATATLRDRRTVVIALCAVGWVFAQGMVENTTLYGEQRTMILVALAIGYLYALYPNSPEPQRSLPNGAALVGTAARPV